MAAIHKLSELVISQIAAGEAIENPAGVLKELIENSLDADATSLDIFISGAGFEKIRVRDNGSGINREHLPLALESFATSKIETAEDIFSVATLGFRGEALGSICSVSKITIESRERGAERAYKITARADETGNTEPSAFPEGTQVLVEDLFFNAPVRREFSGQEKALKKKLGEIVVTAALSRHDVSFRAHIDGAEYFFPQAENLLERIRQAYNAETADSLLPVYFNRNNHILKGYISSFSTYKSSPADIRLFVNGRPVQWKKLVGLLRNAYGELLPPGRFPLAFLFFDSAGREVDANVHPQKKEIRFREEDKTAIFFLESIRNVIENNGPLKMKNLQPGKGFSGLRSLPQTTPPEELKFEFVKKLAEPFQEDLLKSSVVLNSEHTRPTHIPTEIHARLFNTFILASSEEGLYLIDQHTAHERINYERYLKSLSLEKNVEQELVTPVSLGLSLAEQKTLDEYLPILESLGFRVEDMGPAGMSLLSVPVYVPPGMEENAFRKAMAIAEGRADVTPRILFEQLAKDLACWGAIKKGDPESLANLRELVEQLAECDVPTRCPHGRPTMVFLGRDEIFALFKRHS